MENSPATRWLSISILWILLCQATPMYAQTPCTACSATAIYFPALESVEITINCSPSGPGSGIDNCWTINKGPDLSWRVDLCEPVSCLTLEGIAGVDGSGSAQVEIFFCASGDCGPTLSETCAVPFPSPTSTADVAAGSPVTGSISTPTGLTVLSWSVIWTGSQLEYTVTNLSAAPILDLSWPGTPLDGEFVELGTSVAASVPRSTAPISVFSSLVGVNFATGLPIIDLSVVTPTSAFVRGDCNADQSVDVSDAVSLLGILFIPGFPPAACDDSCDSDDDGSVDVGDAILLLSTLFVAGPMLSPPTPPCGADPTTDAIGCEGFQCP